MATVAAFNRTQQAVDAIGNQQMEEEEQRGAPVSSASEPLDCPEADAASASGSSSPVGLSTLLSDSD